MVSTIKVLCSDCIISIIGFNIVKPVAIELSSKIFVLYLQTRLSSVRESTSFQIGFSPVKNKSLRLRSLMSSSKKESGQVRGIHPTHKPRLNFCGVESPFLSRRARRWHSPPHSARWLADESPSDSQSQRPYLAGTVRWQDSPGEEKSNSLHRPSPLRKCDNLTPKGYVGKRGALSPFSPVVQSEKLSPLVLCTYRNSPGRKREPLSSSKRRKLVRRMAVIRGKRSDNRGMGERYQARVESQMSTNKAGFECQDEDDSETGLKTRSGIGEEGEVSATRLGVRSKERYRSGAHVGEEGHMSSGRAGFDCEGEGEMPTRHRIRSGVVEEVKVNVQREGYSHVRQGHSPVGERGSSTEKSLRLGTGRDHLSDKLYMENVGGSCSRNRPSRSGLIRVGHGCEQSIRKDVSDKVSETMINSQRKRLDRSSTALGELASTEKSYKETVLGSHRNRQTWSRGELGCGADDRVCRTSRGRRYLEVEDQYEAWSAHSLDRSGGSQGTEFQPRVSLCRESLGESYLGDF